MRLLYAARGLGGAQPPLDVALITLQTLLESRELIPVGVEADAEDADLHARRRDPLQQVFARFVTPEDSTWRWEVTATGEPITIVTMNGRKRVTAPTTNTTIATSHRL